MEDIEYVDHICCSIYFNVINDKYRFFFRYRIGYIIMIILHAMILIAKYLSTIALFIQHSQEIVIANIILTVFFGISEMIIIHVILLIYDNNPLMIFIYFDKLDNTFPNDSDNIYCFGKYFNNVDSKGVCKYITYFIFSIGLTNSIQIVLVNCYMFDRLILLIPQCVFFGFGIIYLIILNTCCVWQEDVRTNIESSEKLIPNNIELRSMNESDDDSDSSDDGGDGNDGDSNDGDSNDGNDGDGNDGDGNDGNDNSKKYYHKHDFLYSFNKSFDLL